jgi:hypothetical protein
VPAGEGTCTDNNPCTSYDGSQGGNDACDGHGACRSRQVKTKIELLKLTGGVVDSTQTWTFRLYNGPDGFGSTVVASGSTLGITNGILNFGGIELNPNNRYTICEIGVPAGWSSLWKLGGNIVIPYNPDADSVPSEDVGNRCYDFGPNFACGGTLRFEVNNKAPGGSPRSPGYWKNWNRCTTGGQSANAARNGGYAKGFWLLEDVLNPAVGGGIVWDDILVDTKLVNITTCEQAVEILDQRAVKVNGVVGDGKKLANDAARTLSMHLLAAQLNFGAGACTTQKVLETALAAERLLDKINFDGTKPTAELTSKEKADYNEALRLAGILDAYNNGAYCGDTH